MTNAYPSSVSESTHTHASPSASADFHRPPQEVAAGAKNATAANISGVFRQPVEQNNARKLTELTMPLSAWKPSLTGNTWSFLSAISASCRESRRKSVNKKQSRFNAAVLLFVFMTERRLCLGIMGRRRRNRWPDCGKHFAPPVQERKKNWSTNWDSTFPFVVRCIDC